MSTFRISTSSRSMRRRAAQCAVEQHPVLEFDTEEITVPLTPLCWRARGRLHRAHPQGSGRPAIARRPLPSDRFPRTTCSGHTADRNPPTQLARPVLDQAVEDAVGLAGVR